MVPPVRADDDMNLEFDLERLINDTLTSGAPGAESPDMAPHPPPDGPPPSLRNRSNPSPVSSPGASGSAAKDLASETAAIAELVNQQNADMSVRINNYERLFACAEHLAAAKKQVDELVKEEGTVAPDVWAGQQQKISQLKITMGRICMQMSEELGITVPPMDPVHAEETLTPLIYRCIPRDQAGQLLSIGSIPHFCGEACVGPCRFHRKGKCFDGPLCRFCHMEGPHPGAVKKVPKKSRKVKKAPLSNGMPGQVGIGNEQTALAALFAALDVSTDERPADAYFPPYGMEPYQHPQYDAVAPHYNRDAAPAYGAGYGHGMYQPWANGGVPLIY
jgi:hypothetical protein